MKIYTKTGDDGTTSLYRGGRVSKAHPLIRAIGAVDELNSWLGVVRAGSNSPSISSILARLQHQMFELGAELATLEHLDQGREPGEQAGTDSAASDGGRLNSTHVEWLESTIDECERQLPALQNFILPGGSMVAAQCHLARAVCRRAERDVVDFAVQLQQSTTDRLQIARVYLNRLADLLFVLARRINMEDQVSETIWGPDLA